MSKKTFMAAIIILAFLFSLVSGMQAVKVAKANPFWIYNFIEPVPGTIPCNIAILSPQNDAAYYSDKVNVSFIVSKPKLSSASETAITYVNYTIDEKTVQAYAIHPYEDGFGTASGIPEFYTTFGLSLPLGNHTLTVTAEGVVWAGGLSIFFIDSFSTVFFMIDASAPSPSPSPAPLSSPSPAPTSTIALTASLSESASALNFGNRVNFTVTVEGGKAPYTYTWNIEQSSDVILVETSSSPYYSSDTFGPGSHHVYVDVKDADNNTGKTLTVEFNVLPLSSSPTFPSPSTTPTVTPPEFTTQQPTAEPSPSANPTPSRRTSNANVALEIIGLIVTASIVAVGSVAYFRKRRSNHE